MKLWHFFTAIFIGSTSVLTGVAFANPTHGMASCPHAPADCCVESSQSESAASERILDRLERGIRGDI